MEPETVCEEIAPIDLPPEYCRYEDEGCELSGSCLRCPFSICAYEPGGKRKLLRARRDRKIAGLFKKGKDTAVLASMFGISRRTIQRIIKGSKLKIQSSKLIR